MKALRMSCNFDRFLSTWLPPSSHPPLLPPLGRLVDSSVCILVASHVELICNPMGYSLPGFFVHGISQERILGRVVVSFSRGSSQPRHWTQVFCIAARFFTVWDPREAPHQCRKPNKSQGTGRCSEQSCLSSGHCWPYMKRCADKNKALLTAQGDRVNILQ